MNSTINAFIEGKKLQLSSKKCHRIPVKNPKSKDASNWMPLKVHEEKMNDATQEKYLGDIVNNSGTNRKTIEERKNKGYGIVSEITAILEEIPLGRYKHEIGLKLRQAMFLNGILYNSEAWHSISEEEIKTFNRHP